MRISTPRRQRAVVLLVALAILTVLALLATVFATTSRIERTVARNYVDLVRAKLLAESGIEVGSKVLRQVPAPLPASLTYYGEDHDASGNLANAWGVAEDVYRPGSPPVAGTMQTLDCPLSYALRPSLWADLDGNLRPDVITVTDANAPGGTRQVGFSGSLAGTYARLGDTYSIKIVDQNDLIDVNDVMVNTAGGVVEPNTRMARVINTLSQVLGLAGNEGTLIANWRALNAPMSVTTAPLAGGGYSYNVTTGVTGGFTTVEQIQQIPFFPPASYQVLKDYLSTNAWKDVSTILPMPQTFAAIQPCNSYSLQAAAPPDKYNFQYRFEPRSPVNVNSAPYAVLTALMSGLQANYVAVVPGRFNGATETERYQVQSASIPTYSGAGSTPARIASTIIWYRQGTVTVQGYKGPFGTWEDWNNFVDNCLVGSSNPFGSALINDLQGKVLKAAFNPNTRSMRANPDRSARFRRSAGGTRPDVDIDKTDMAVYSTELCFSPMGTFALSSLGRIVDLGGNIVAEYEIRTVAKAFDVVRHSTARDFRMNSVSFATQYVATLPDSPPDHTGGSEPANPGGTENKELGSTYNVPREDDRWAYDGAIVERTRDPNGIAETYLWPSTTAGQGGGMLWEVNATAAPQPMGFNGPKPREDRSLFGMRTGGGMPGDSIKGDIFSDGIYLGSDRYRALSYALPWRVATTSQAQSNLTGMSLEYWMKPNCEGTTNSSMRRGYEFIRSDIGTMTIDQKIWHGNPGLPSFPSFVTWTPGDGYAEFSCRWFEQMGVLNHDGILRQRSSTNVDPTSIPPFYTKVGAPSNEMYGTKWDWQSSSGPSKLLAGMWHHFYFGTWDDGWYTASNMFVDGLLQAGVLNRYGDPASGWVTLPFCEYNTPRAIVIWLRVQPFQDLGNVVDVACNVHDLSYADEPPNLTLPLFGSGFPDPDRLFAGTMDGFRIRQSQSVPSGPPSRLNPGVNAQYAGSINRSLNPATGQAVFPGKEMPSGNDVLVTSVEWTRYRPLQRNDGTVIPDDPTTPDGPLSQRPTTQFSYGTVGSGFPYTLGDETGKAQPLVAAPSAGYLVTSSSEFQYRIRFDNRNISPLNMSAYFDDVTLHYYTANQPVQFVSWQAGVIR